MFRFSLFLIALLAALPAHADDVSLQTGDVAIMNLPDQSAVRFTMITTSGYVGFTAGGHWRVKEMKSKPPITTTVFDITDDAARYGHHEVTLTVNLFERGRQATMEVQAFLASVYARMAVTETHYKNWTLHERLGDEPYRLVDADMVIAGEICHVELKWPDIQGETYREEKMVLLKAFLDSVAGEKQAYVLHDGEGARRPE